MTPDRVENLPDEASAAEHTGGEVDWCSILTVESDGVSWGFESNLVVEILLERDWTGGLLDVASLHGLPAGDPGDPRHLIVLSMWIEPILVVGRLTIQKIDRRKVVPLPDELLSSSPTVVESVAFRDGLHPILLVDVNRITRKGPDVPHPPQEPLELGAKT